MMEYERCVHKKLRGLFEYLDTDGDGRITISCLQSGITKLQYMQQSSSSDVAAAEDDSGDDPANLPPFFSDEDSLLKARTPQVYICYVYIYYVWMYVFVYMLCVVCGCVLYVGKTVCCSMSCLLTCITLLLYIYALM